MSKKLSSSKECPNCKKIQSWFTGNICQGCYRKYKWKPKKSICPRCKRLIKIHAQGLCSGCYNYTFYLESTKAHNHKKIHNISYETYKKITSRCLICGFDKVVDLHHLDEDHKNNSEKNMIGLCPNHHKMLHNFQFREEVLTQIREALADDKSPLPREETEALIIESEPLIDEPEATALDRPLEIPINQRNFLA